jgi:transposase
MKRYMGTQDDGETIKKLLKQEQAGWLKVRLIALKMGFNKHNSVSLISESTGQSESTIQRWFDQYRKEGLEAVL